MDDADKNVCQSCGSPVVEQGYEMPLCSICRDKLSQRPLPGMMKGAFALVLLIVLFALTQFPRSLVAGVAFERGQKAESAGNYTAAVNEYRQVVDRFPDSTTALARLGISQYRAGDIGSAVDTLGKLEGREASDELFKEVNGVIDEIHKRVMRGRIK